MPLGFLDEVEERVSVPIGLGEGRRKRALERDKRGDQVSSVVGRAWRRAQGSQAFSGFAKAFASGLHRLGVDRRPGACKRPLQQKAGKLDQAPTQAIVQRLSLAHVAREGIGQTQSAPPFRDVAQNSAPPPRAAASSLGPAAAGRPWLDAR